MDFSFLVVGAEYDRPTLARLWGYESFNAISRGVVTPRGVSAILLFVTREKQETLTQYEDRIDRDVLFWEGEKGHGSDNRIVEGRDEVHLFYRDRHHQSFTYKGRVVVRQYHLYSDRPSKFSFNLIDLQIGAADLVSEIELDYGIESTEKKALVSSRIGQGVYRQRALELWRNCAVTGFTHPEVLVASHIKPWKFSDNSERLNPYNSLVLVPTLDGLFDRGLIGFEDSGRILLSDRIDNLDWPRIRVSPDLRLRNVPEKTLPFLAYHRNYVFDLTESRDGRAAAR